MTAFQDSFQAEVARLVRKQVKDDQAALKQSDRKQREEVSALKQEVKSLSTQVRSLTKQLAKLEALVQSQLPEKEPRVSRSAAGFVFNHEALIAKRHELGLTQAQMAQLLGVSNLTAYKWETGAVQPRDKKLARLQEVLKMGPRQAQKALKEPQE
ncbi:helix-turn-helix domain-containing protein [Acidovorax temperans]|uniref:helix-turn-helix domain-containing protein n=1 Tax=Acidovorax temperans TaxID=80878 RepID=UPI0023581527|nr:helix-turn-helix domain-containing protein [Acidovorax temperans]WCT26727.1 helix-turn-helix domain-containing protein [Acidovorax temperans]